ncbi:MAG: hypothetical protein WAW96_20530 [Alphaproteobacteria bacterium]
MRLLAWASLALFIAMFLAISLVPGQVISVLDQIYVKVILYFVSMFCALLVAAFVFVLAGEWSVRRMFMRAFQGLLAITTGVSVGPALGLPQSIDVQTKQGHLSVQLVSAAHPILGYFITGIIALLLLLAMYAAYDIYERQYLP